MALPHDLGRCPGIGVQRALPENNPFELPSRTPFARFVIAPKQTARSVQIGALLSERLVKLVGLLSLLGIDLAFGRLLLDQASELPL
jgi:hypothetical protein